MIAADRFDGVIFDLDGVVTDTAAVHEAAWTRLFTEFLGRHGAVTGEEQHPFTTADYVRFVDGKPRYDGVRSFLASRGIDLPEGADDDPADSLSVHALGNRKDQYFLEHLEREGVGAFPSTVVLVRSLQSLHVATAIVSASRNLSAVLRSAGLSRLFPVSVDGVTSEELGLPGKPDPAVYLEAARRLDVSVTRAVVVEDALAGVDAGRRGGFGLVIGVARTASPHALRQRGAHVVVSDLADVTAVARSGQTTGSRPSGEVP